MAIQPLVVEALFHLPPDIVAEPAAVDHGRLQGDILPSEAGGQDQFDPEALPFGAIGAVGIGAEVDHAGNAPRQQAGAQENFSEAAQLLGMAAFTRTPIGLRIVAPAAAVQPEAQAFALVAVGEQRRGEIKDAEDSHDHHDPRRHDPGEAEPDAQDGAYKLRST